VILEGCYIPEIMCGHVNWCSDGGLGCDGMRPMGPVRYDWTDPWDQTGQGGVLRGVSEVTLMGSKYGQLNGT